jgi:hypothetical protein
MRFPHAELETRWQDALDVTARRGYGFPPSRERRFEDNEIILAQQCAKAGNPCCVNHAGEKCARLKRRQRTGLHLPEQIHVIAADHQLLRPPLQFHHQPPPSLVAGPFAGHGVGHQAQFFRAEFFRLVGAGLDLLSNGLRGRKWKRALVPRGGEADGWRLRTGWLARHGAGSRSQSGQTCLTGPARRSSG